MARVQVRAHVNLHQPNLFVAVKNKIESDHLEKLDIFPAVIPSKLFSFLFDIPEMALNNVVNDFMHVFLNFFKHLWIASFQKIQQSFFSIVNISVKYG